MLTLYRRHRQPTGVDPDGKPVGGCPKRSDRYWRRCDCPMWVEGTISSQYIRRSLKTTSWERAAAITRKMEEEQDPAKPEGAVTVEAAVKDFIADHRIRELRPSSISKYAGLFERSFLPWCQAEGCRYLREIDLRALKLFRATWENSSRTKFIKQSRIGEFFRFCIASGWVDKNPTIGLSRIRVDQKPTDYFLPEEFRELLDATRRYDPTRKNSVHGERLRALLLLLRWSGLRIGDAVTLARHRLTGDRLLLYVKKTGTPVFVPLPPEVVSALHSMPPGHKPHPGYFFWSGNGNPANVAVIWQRAFRVLCGLTTLKRRCHPHMLRDTFAVELLLSGVSIEQVSILLGHSTVAMTERHYAPWVKARQEKLISDVRASWPTLEPGVDSN